MTTEFLVIGEALIDIVERPDGTSDEHVGGSPANVALGLARLGHSTALACALGNDARGQRIGGLLGAEGIDLGASHGSILVTSTAHARLDESGAANYTFDLDWVFDADTLDITPTHVHTGSIAAQLDPGADHVLDYLRSVRESASISFDPNVRPDLMHDVTAARARVEDIVALSDVVKASDEDLEFLYPGVPVEQVLADWAASGPAIVIATLGPHGALAHTAAGLRDMPIGTVHVVDTVGAGDSYMAGLLSGLMELGLLGAQGRGALHEADVSLALDRARRASVITVGGAGADLPRLPELQ